METIVAAIIGAAASALLFFYASISGRRERDIREIFSRLRELENTVAKQNPQRARDWRSWIVPLDRTVSKIYIPGLML